MKNPLLPPSFLLAIASLMAARAEAPAEAAPASSSVVSATVELVDGSRLLGTPKEKGLKLNMEYARVELPLARIRHFEMRPKEERVVVTLRNGDRLTGILESAEFPMETLLGNMAPEFAQISNIRFDCRSGQALPANGLVAHYPLDGSAEDVVDKHHSGTVCGASPTTDRFGAPNSAFSFDGATQHIELGRWSPLSGNAGTMSAWVMVEDGLPTNDYILAKGHDFMTGGSYAIHLGSEDRSVAGANAHCMVAAANITWAKSGVGRLRSGQWHHITGVIDGAEARIYVDGKRIHSTPFPGVISSTDRPLWIGGQDRPGFNYFFKGKIDDVRIYDRPLGDLEIEALSAER